MNTLTKEQVRLRLGIALSTLNNKIDPKSPWHDPSFPKKIMIGPRSVRFSEAELVAWIERQSTAPTDRPPTRSLNSTVVRTVSNASGVEVTARGSEPAELRVDPTRSVVEPAESKGLRPTRRVEQKGELDSSESEMTARGTFEHSVQTITMHGVTVQELHIDSPPPLSIGDLIRAAKDRGNQVRMHPDWPSEFRAMLERIAGQGSTVSQSGAFSSTDVLGFWNPSEEVSALLDGIDLHSYNSHGVLLTAVLYDAPSQCDRLVRFAYAVGIHDPAPELLRLQREKLFAQYERTVSQAVGVPTWTQFGDRFRIVRA